MNITVFAGAEGGDSSKYAECAKKLGRWIVKEGHTLYYGGGAAGLMGALADAAQEAGGKVIGIIPEFMVEKGWCRKGLDQVIVVKDMSERKVKLYEAADLCLALPGGAGTIEEVADCVSWKRLELTEPDCVLLNCDGFYDTFLQFYDTITEHKFLPEQGRRSLIDCKSLNDLAQLVENLKNK